MRFAQQVFADRHSVLWISLCQMRRIIVCYRREWPLCHVPNSVATGPRRPITQNASVAHCVMDLLEKRPMDKQSSCEGKEVPVTSRLVKNMKLEIDKPSFDLTMYWLVCTTGQGAVQVRRFVERHPVSDNRSHCKPTSDTTYEHYPDRN